MNQRKGRYGGGPQSSTAINQNSVAVYKQMMEKERKHWAEERARKDRYVEEIQEKALKLSNELVFSQKQIDDLEQDIQIRDQCESKVN